MVACLPGAILEKLTQLSHMVLNKGRECLGVKLDTVAGCHDMA